MMFVVTAHSTLVVIRNWYMEVLACGFAREADRRRFSWRLAPLKRQ